MRLTLLAAFVVGLLVPRAALAVQGAELFRVEPYFYGRFEARIRYAPGEGVVSAYFLWKDGSSATTSWNEVDYEKINASCRMQTNLWTGTGTQSTEITTPAFDICGEYHTYAIEWTPDYISWLIDGKQLRKVTGASVAEYTRNASQGMTMHFNIWQGDSDFGGVLNPSSLPVRQYVAWAQYSSYANGAFQQQWREEFNGSTVPDGWAVGDWKAPLEHSMHNPANVTFVNGIAVLSMTADNATGFTGTPPADPAGAGGAGGGGTSGGGAGSSGAGGTGRGGASGSAGGKGGGTTGGGGNASSGSGGTMSSGSGGMASGGSGTGGVTDGSGGSATGGSSTGGSSSGGSSSGGSSSGGSGSGGSATGGQTSSGGSSATGGTSSTGGNGAPGSGGSSGSGGAHPPVHQGCSYTPAGGTSTGLGGLLTLLLGAASAVRRRSAKRSARR